MLAIALFAVALHLRPVLILLKMHRDFIVPVRGIVAYKTQDSVKAYRMTTQALFFLFSPQ